VRAAAVTTDVCPRAGGEATFGEEGEGGCGVEVDGSGDCGVAVDDGVLAREDDLAGRPGAYLHHRFPGVTGSLRRRSAAIREQLQL
jgi:hypothetical protein